MGETGDAGENGIAGTPGTSGTKVRTTAIAALPTVDPDPNHHTMTMTPDRHGS